MSNPWAYVLLPSGYFWQKIILPQLIVSLHGRRAKPLLQLEACVT